MTIENAFDVLADAGYAVCAFSPEALRGVSVHAIKIVMSTAGLEMIDFLAADVSKS